MELRIATPQIILNYAAFLQEHKFWEEAFRVYERGIALFKWPHVKDLWQAYLAQFVARYKGTKLERARDLYRQAIESAPAKDSKQLYLGFAALEEQYGLSRSAMEVYDKAVQGVPPNERLEVYTIYVAKATHLFGVGKVREIYETAIEAEGPYGLPDQDCKKLCLRYAKLERSIGEVDRARAIYVHASSMADPRRDPGFWEEWKSFEVAHGNEDTFREMLRLKRSVTASYSQTHFNTTIIDATTAPAAGMAIDTDLSGKRKREGDDMAALEAAMDEQAEAAPAPSRIPGFVSAGIIQGEKAAAEADKPAVASGPIAANPEEMDLDDIPEDGDGDVADENEVQIHEKAVPAAVFGSAAAGSAEQEPEKLGALDRFKKRKT
jgi:pre-mRNA-splicing factor SYF1